MSKLFLDTNVLIYAIDEESKYFHPAQKLMSAKEIDLYTSSKNISEFLAVITRSPQNSISMQDALRVVEIIEDLCTILYPSVKSFRIFKKLLDQYRPSGLLIHDYEIISIGLSHGIDKIATFNVRDFERVKEIQLYPI